jgi:hypothetical protein
MTETAGAFAELIAEMQRIEEKLRGSDLDEQSLLKTRRAPTAFAGVAVTRSTSRSRCTAGTRGSVLAPPIRMALLECDPQAFGR